MLRQMTSRSGGGSGKHLHGGDQIRIKVGDNIRTVDVADTLRKCQ